MQPLRTEIEPDILWAEQVYPKVVDALLNYTDLVDRNGDEDGSAYQKVIDYLTELTGKDIANRDYAIWEYWEAGGVHHESFKIALPDPKVVTDISYDELWEIVHRIVELSIPAYLNTNFIQQNDFVWEICDYYRHFLALNFKKYKPQFFNRQKNAQGEWYEPGVEEIVGLLSTKG